MKGQASTMEKLLLTAEEAADVLGLGRTKVYALISKAEIESVLIGKNRRIPSDALVEYVQKLRQENGVAA